MAEYGLSEGSCCSYRPALKRCATLITCCNYEYQVDLTTQRFCGKKKKKLVRLPSERVAHLLEAQNAQKFDIVQHNDLAWQPKTLSYWQSATFGRPHSNQLASVLVAKHIKAPPLLPPPPPLSVNLLPNAAPVRKQLMPASVGVRRQPNSCVWATCCASSTDNYGNPKAEQPLGEFNNVQVDAISL